MRKIVICICVFFLIGCQTAPEGVVARVFDQDITTDAFQREFDFYETMYKTELKDQWDQLTEEDKNKQNLTIEKGVLEKLILRKLIDRELTNQGISITEKDLQHFKDEKIEALGGQEEFAAFLKSAGIQESLFDDALREEYSLGLLKDAFAQTHELSDKELEKVFEEHKEKFYKYSIRLILVDTKDEAEEIYQSFRPFEELAILHSKDVLSATEGGKIENYHLGDREKALDEAVQAMEPKGKARIIEGEEGYYILHLDEKQEDFSSLKEDVYRSAIHRDFEKYIETIRAKAEVKVFKKFAGK
ncbi:MAG: SurA N-terminal domain-containing protein [Tissierellia bacterium]|nr:SurA N-terminal domain-containing protein [Tissierellia bacterium]